MEGEKGRRVKGERERVGKLVRERNSKGKEEKKPRGKVRPEKAVKHKEKSLEERNKGTRWKSDGKVRDTS